MIIVKAIKKLIRKAVLSSVPELMVTTRCVENTTLGSHTLVCTPGEVYDSSIGDYTYLSANASVHHTKIGKFCSIGPNFFCGWGMHPLNGISTAPVFYSKTPPNDVTFSSDIKVEEMKPITIGNDVFIGANVTVLDGVTIGDGAVIGAGAVVSKDIPPYAIAVGCPIKIINYRFTEELRNKLLESKWWEFNEEGLKKVEQMFFTPEAFVEEFVKDENK